ncbi:MAG: Fe-Mn family superoxide dismutase [Buchnera aphidicola (Floraphis choui)]
MSYILPLLPYSYDSLEPYLDEKTMRIHHTKHHQAYINNTNDILYDSDFVNLSIEDLVSKLNSINVSNKIGLRNNAGGHANHSLFWKILKIGTVLKGNFKIVLENNFGSIENFKKKFETVAMSHFGSGWVWLVKQNKKLFISTTMNQDTPLMGKDISGISGFPIFGLDIWEHAYYLKYQNRRIDYIRAFWNILDWNEVSNRFNG